MHGYLHSGFTCTWSCMEIAGERNHEIQTSLVFPIPLYKYTNPTCQHLYLCHQNQTTHPLYRKTFRSQKPCFHAHAMCSCKTLCLERKKQRQLMKFKKTLPSALVLRSAVGMTHSLRSDLWWTIPFRLLLGQFWDTYLSIEAQCVSHHYPRWTATTGLKLYWCFVLNTQVGQRATRSAAPAGPLLNL